DAALPLYREVHARLGEANTLQALAATDLAEGRVHASFTGFLAVREIQERDLHDALGVSGTHLFLMRVVLAAGRTQQAVALAVPALRFYASVEDAFDQMLVFAELARAFAEDNTERALDPAFCCWQFAIRAGDPNADALGQLFTQVMKDSLDPGDYEHLMADLEEHAHERVDALLAKVQADVEAGRLDPYEVPPG
ncbi:hypothetical protein OAX78_04315, partial [Planctomycetota bacterium]|nr:hypothetical protein [Planctomycetota bacterium]